MSVGTLKLGKVFRKENQCSAEQNLLKQQTPTLPNTA